MKILYLGVDNGTSMQRFRALGRLGHDVTLLSPEAFLPRNRFAAKCHWETGGLLISDEIRRKVMADLRLSDQYDCVWVDNGRYVGSTLVQDLRRRFGPVIAYNLDDPFGRRDRFSFELFRRTVKDYDLVVVVRSENCAEAKALGAKDVMHAYRCADEVAHAPRDISAADAARLASDVLFVGTCMEGRGRFMLDLIESGIPLQIRGTRWDRCPEWPRLQSRWLPALENPDEYTRAIQCAKISLGLLSRGNRDLHTQRSMEVPYLGGLFCAQRTSEHSALYVEGEEAVFWSDSGECVKVCQDLLADEAKRIEIARKGQIRSRQNGNLNEQMMERVLARVFDRVDN